MRTNISADIICQPRKIWFRAVVILSFGKVSIINEESNCIITSIVSLSVSLIEKGFSILVASSWLKLLRICEL